MLVVSFIICIYFFIHFYFCVLVVSQNTSGQAMDDSDDQDEPVVTVADSLTVTVYLLACFLLTHSRFLADLHPVSS